MKISSIKYLCLITICSLLIAGVSFGQEISVKASLRSTTNSRTVYVGDRLEYVITISGKGAAVGTVDTAPLKPFGATHIENNASSSSSMSFSVNGKQVSRSSTEYIMSYSLLMQKGGRNTIKGVDVTVKGKTYTTQPKAFTVNTPEKTDFLILDLDVNEKICFVGQAVRVDFDLTVLRNISDMNLNVFQLFPLSHFTVVPHVPLGQGGNKRQIDLGNDVVVDVREDNSRYKNEPSLKYLFSILVIPKYVGTLSGDLPQVVCNVQIGQGRFSKHQKMMAKAPPISLTINPLPTKGKPDNFKGLLGRYRIETSATPTEISIGDPITLEIKISGDLLSVVEMPDLSQLSSFMDHFKILKEQSTPKVINGTKVLIQTIRLSDDQVNEVPAIPLSYFDVDKSKYVVVFSKPIPLLVKETRMVTAAQAQGGNVAVGPMVSQVEAIQHGVATNYSGDDLLTNATFSIVSTMRAPLGLTVWVAPFVLLFMSIMQRFRSSHDPEKLLKRRKGGALSIAVKRLRALRANSELGSDDVKRELADLLRDFVADRYDKVGHSLTERDCEKFFKDDAVDQAYIDDFIDSLERSLQSRFAGGASDSSNFDFSAIEANLKALVTK